MPEQNTTQPTMEELVIKRLEANIVEVRFAKNRPFVSTEERETLNLLEEDLERMVRVLEGGSYP